MKVQCLKASHHLRKLLLKHPFPLCRSLQEKVIHLQAGIQIRHLRKEHKKKEISGATADITLYAKWEPVIYTITYIVTDSPTTFDTYTIESETITLPEPSVVGYTFEGWYKDSEFTDGTQITEIANGSTGNITLYAKMTQTSSGINYTTPDVGLIEAKITPEGTEFKASDYAAIQFRVTNYSPSGQMTSPLEYKWYLDGEQMSTDSTYMLYIKTDDNVTAGSHVLTVIITDSTSKIATGTKQFVVIK